MGEDKIEEKKRKSDRVEVEKRIYQVSLMLRRKPIAFIVNYIKQEWGLEKVQAYNYIKEARKEWQKYFTNLKHAGIAYHITQMRDLKDQAYSRKVVVGTVDNKQVINVPDLGLILDITKEEAKLMGAYPANKEDINVKHSGEIDNKLTHVLKMEDEELNELIKRLSKAGTGDSTTGAEEKRDK